MKPVLDTVFAHKRSLRRRYLCVAGHACNVLFTSEEIIEKITLLSVLLGKLVIRDACVYGEIN